MLAPNGFSQTIDEQAFVDAQITANKRVGVLRFTLPSIVLSAAVALIGVNTMVSNGRSVAFLISGIGLICTALMLVSFFLKIIPEALKIFAKSNFLSYDKLSNGAQITFTSDDMTIRSPFMVRRVAYAKTRICIETAARFVIVTDEDAVIILEKSCFVQLQETIDFLRDVFARRYVKGRL